MSLQRLKCTNKCFVNFYKERFLTKNLPLLHITKRLNSRVIFEKKSIKDLCYTPLFCIADCRKTQKTGTFAADKIGDKIFTNRKNKLISIVIRLEK